MFYYLKIHKLNYCLLYIVTRKFSEKLITKGHITTKQAKLIYVVLV